MPLTLSVPDYIGTSGPLTLTLLSGTPGATVEARIGNFAPDWRHYGLPVAWLQGTYNENDVDRYVRTQTDTGPGKMRPRSTKQIKDVTFTARCNLDQLAGLEQLHEHAAAWGGVFYGPSIRAPYSRTYRFAGPLKKVEVMKRLYDVTVTARMI